MTRPLPILVAVSALAAACVRPPDQVAPDAAGPPPACLHDPRPAVSYRLFAVGHKLSLSEAESPLAFEAAIRSTVQRDVAPNLAGDRPNILVFPESVAFPTVFGGDRGANARAQASALEAFSALVVNLVTESNFYAEFADGAAGKLALLAVTDPTWRAFDTTFSNIAREYGVYVVAGIDVGDVEVTEDPLVIDAVGDPQRPDGSPVYWVPEGEVYNQAIFYEPSGAMIGRVHKAYLTDLEANELEIRGGLPEQLGPVDVGGMMNAAAMISRDAWMQDALDRVVMRGADVLLQNEAYIGWTVAPDGYAWPPDNLKRSAWAAVQKYPELRAAVAPMYAGNFFDINFDGQSFAVRDGTPGDEPMALLAQEPDVGWAAIAPWVEPDPMAGTLDERRAVLAAVGEALKPGGARDDEYVAGTVWIDVDLRKDDAYPRVDDAEPDGGEPILGRSWTVLAHGIGRKRSASLAVEQAGKLVMAWEDTRYCAGQIVASRTTDGGATWTEPVRVQPWNRPQHDPQILSLGEESMVVAWQEITNDGTGEIRVSRSTDAGLTWSPRVRVDFENTGDAWQPSLARDPVSGDLLLAFVDARPRGDASTDARGDDPNYRVYVTRSANAGRSWSAPVRVDSRERTDSIADSTFTNEWSPSIAVAGTYVIVAYTHRHRPDPAEQPSHDVFVAESIDGGLTFGAPARLDGGGFPERIASDVALDLAPDGTWTVFWTSLRGVGYDADIAMASSAFAGVVLAPDADPPRDQWFPAAARFDDRLAVVWQDFRGGSNDIYLSEIAGGEFGEVQRVDDGGGSAAQSWRPTIAINEFGVGYAVWEDSRTGHAELRIARKLLFAAPPPKE
jgi:predicted amidohydrolase